ncbi:hypothetical protein FVEG_02368 [Fusarium verticillioides 7600]|uniref:Uncharacterized protein n=1 Tax=Gibberella moniliformis (strain M3125 / FGSC 7600) TaxID=334819 RepID=W7LVT1_GIBM7|nr:hypothetical protein FVEG_02368 [Fusarium verticillioides 7600]EWG39605.1 hypothetical protein FVEG_02368 [Fusarium verticillioides 7600]
MGALPVLEDAETSPFRLQHGYRAPKVRQGNFTPILPLGLFRSTYPSTLRVSPSIGLPCFALSGLASFFLSLFLSPPQLFISLLFPPFPSCPISLFFINNHQILPSKAYFNFNNTTSTPQTPITNQHHQYACLRVLLPVWRHDCHQHHLHRLRPQAMQQLPSVLKHSSTDTSRRHSPPLLSQHTLGPVS